MSGGGFQIESGPLTDRRQAIVVRRQTLEGRLEEGYRRIEDALRDGADVGTWEGFWIQLLREYEAVCDDLRPAA